jgi:capsular exopolysaccharide synthesis family protein
MPTSSLFSGYNLARYLTFRRGLAANPPDYEPPQPGEERHLLEYLDIALRRKRLVIAVALAVATYAAVRTFMTRSVYQATAQILIERESQNILTFKEVTAVDSARDDYYQTQYKLLQSRSLARKVIESQNLLQDPEFGGPRDPAGIEAARKAEPGASPVMEGAINALVGRLAVQPVKNSRLVSVSFEAFRPELTALVANELARKYIEQTLEFRYQTSAEAGEWLGQQIEDQRKKVEESEVTLQKLKEREGIVNIEERRTLLDQKLKELGTALNTLKTQRLEKEALFVQMRSAGNPEELPDVMRNPLVQSLRIELATLERQLAQLLELYLDQHPEVVRVRNQIQEMRRRIAGEAQRVIRAAENDYKAAAAQEQKIAEALEAAKAETLGLSSRAIQYDTLKRELDAGKEVLNGLLSRYKQTDVAQELKSSNIRIVDPAVVPRAPIRPNRTRDILYGLLVGFSLGIGLAFFLEYLDNTVKTPEDVRLHLPAPLLGVIAEMEARNPGPVLLSPRPSGPFAEGYRVLRTALNFSWPEQASRILVVTSTAPGEGKTLTSVNLALTLAASDGKVLLIDSDLRKPQAHVLVKAQKRPGLSDVLVGQAKPSDAIQKIAGSNLSFLSAGTHVPSPADLMTTQVWEGLLDGLRRFYTWIVVDSPPVAAVADALILARATDGVVVVIGAEMVPRSGVRQTLQRVADTGVRVLGVVLNRAQIKRHSYYYGHYYGHYYGRYPSAAGSSKVAQIKDRAAR